MNNNLDPENLKIPAFLRKKAIVKQSRQKLILTALDRKQAGLSVHSQKPTAQIKVKEKSAFLRKLKQKVSSSQGTQNSLSTTTKYSRKSGFFPLIDTLPPRRSNTQPQFESAPVQQIQPQSPTGYAEIIPIGTITGYIDKIQVAIIQLEKPLRQGDLIQITAVEMLFQQPVDSMQINRKTVKLAKKGSDIGLKVAQPPQINGTVYKVQIKPQINNNAPSETIEFTAPLF